MNTHPNVDVQSQDSEQTTPPQLTLAQKLLAFDPALHGGEVMSIDLTGAEIF